ncbi:hypothetical protein F0562_016060 [Nyssa sinensis]|uniref:Nectarin-1 n=1 Tax=Nyssa sinensis TaxID=561372 RepID=A0A5J4ZLP9_9ASTE|nr:hypothetical protein F0562_016060 [Nyssa sinensis]
MISRSSKLRRLRLWGVVFDDEDEVVDLETISACFPLLSHLSLCYDLRDGALQHGLQGPFQLENVVVLELGWTVISDLFSYWVSGLLQRCPNLRKLVIYGVVSEAKTHEECQLLANFTVIHYPDPVQDFCIPNTKAGTIRTVRFNIIPCKNSTEVIPDDFIFSGIKSPGNFSDTGLSAISVNPAIFPGLNTLGMSFVRADLKVGGINAPHFHPRATEIVYVVQGRLYSGFVDSTNRVFAKVIEQGEVMVFPRGLVHFQMNVGKSAATIFGSFNSQNPGMQKIPSAIFGSGIDDELLEKAFGLTSRQIRMMKRRFIPKKLG